MNTQQTKLTTLVPATQPKDTGNAEALTALYRKKPVVIAAHQWFQNGDHPEDHVPFDSINRPPTRTDRERYDEYLQTEGRVVRRYRHPEVKGDSICEQCGRTHHVHGWIDTLEQGHRVCPGDWIITGVKGERYPCKPDVFAATYEPAAIAAQPQPTVGGVEYSFRCYSCGNQWEATTPDSACPDESCGTKNRFTCADAGPQPTVAPDAVAYLDLGAGGYVDLGSTLSDEQIAALPKGRHMLGIIGTFGVDGYVPTNAAGRDAVASFDAVCDALHIGAAARSLSTVLMNLSNLQRRADCLSAIERKFFTVTEEGDEEDDFEPRDVCLLNWGHDPDDYVKAFGEALATLPTAPPAQPPSPSEARKPLTDAQIEALRDKTFSINNPFCPVDSKSMRKAVHAAEYAHGIK